MSDRPTNCLCSLIPAIPLPKWTGLDHLVGLRCPACIDAVIESKNEQVREAYRLEAEVKRLQGMIDGLAARVVAQSELLSRKAEIA